MKKLVLMFLFAFVSILSIEAQTYYYRTTGFAMKHVNSYGSWTNWTDWEKSDMLVTIDYDNDIVRIYSPRRQTYQITNYVRRYTDSSGGSQVEFYFIDQDGDRGSMRFRIETNGNSQLYVEFNDIMWVYNLVRTNNRY